MGSQGGFSSKSEGYKFSVNGATYRTHDPVKTGREILQFGGFDPTSDHILIQVTHPGTNSVGLDEEVNFRSEGDRDFLAFNGDRIFRFTMNERGYEWGRGTISEEELRTLGRVAPDRLLFLEQEDSPDQVIEPGAVVDLMRLGTEHIRDGSRYVTVYYKEEPFKLERGIYTGSQLMVRFGVPANYVLNLVINQNELDDIDSEEKLKVRDGMHFVSHAPCGQSS